MSGQNGALDLTPGPGRAPMRRIVARQAAMECRLTLRRGESIVITLLVPLLALIGLSQTDVVRLGVDDRLGYIAPGTIALALTSTAFVGLAIATGYERAYGVLKRLGASALSPGGLLAGKLLAAAAVVALDVVVLGAAAGLLGWRPYAAGLLPALGLMVLATAAFAGFGLLLAGTLRAEATLGLANLVYLLLLVGGGVLFPLPVTGAGLELLPTSALAEGLRAALSTGEGVPLWCWNALGLWAVVGVAAAAKWFRWQ